MIPYAQSAVAIFQAPHQPTLFAYLRTGDKKAYLINITQHHKLTSIRNIITSKCNIPPHCQILYINTRKITPQDQLDQLVLSPNTIIHVIDHRLTNKQYLNIHVKYHQLYTFQVSSHTTLQQFIANQLVNTIMVDARDVLLVHAGRPITPNHTFYQSNIEDHSEIICLNLAKYSNQIQTNTYNHSYLQASQPTTHQLHSKPPIMSYHHSSQPKQQHSNIIDQLINNTHPKIKLTITQSIEDNPFIEINYQNQHIHLYQQPQQIDISNEDQHVNHEDIIHKEVHKYIQSIQFSISNKQQQGRSYQNQKIVKLQSQIVSQITKQFIENMNVLNIALLDNNTNFTLPNSTEISNFINNRKSYTQQKIAKQTINIQLPIYTQFEILSTAEQQQTNKYLKDLTKNNIQKYIDEFQFIENSQLSNTQGKINQQSIFLNTINYPLQNQGTYTIVLDSLQIMNEEVIKTIQQQQYQKLKQTIFVNNKSHLSQGTQQNGTYLSFSGKFPSNGQQSQQFGKETIHSFGQQSGGNNQLAHQLTKSNLIRRSFSFQNKFDSGAITESENNLLELQSQQYFNVRSKNTSNNFNNVDDKNKENLINKNNQGQNEY